MTISAKDALHSDLSSHRQRLLEAVCAVEQLTGARVSLHDTSGFLHSSGLFLPTDRALCHHHCAFCQYVRDLPGGRALCIHSDLEVGMAQAQQAGRPVWRCCHAGLWEATAPVLFQGKVAALFFLGQCRPAGRSEQPALAALQMLGAEPRQALAIYKALPAVPSLALEQGAALLQLALQEILHQFPEGMVQAKLLQSEYSLAHRAVRVLNRQIEQGVNAQSLADMLYVSPDSLNRAFRTELGVSLHQYIDSRRFALACRLLQESKQQVSAIAANVGFRDAATFLHWFRRRAGCTPLSYRQSQGQASPSLSPSPRTDYVVQALAYLQGNFRQPIRVGALAQGMRISPDHLNRLFRRETGKTVTQALWMLRLEAVREQLRNSQASLRSIARQNGFSGERDLSSRFQAAYGMKPEEYREQTNGESSPSRSQM